MHWSALLRFVALEELPAGVFDGLRNARWIRLERNRLADLPKGLFDKLTSLDYLYCSHNRLAEVPRLDKLRNLIGLALQYNDIQRITNETFRSLPNLIGLDLSANNLSLPVIRTGSTFAHSKALRFLSLAGNQHIPHGA